MTEFKSVSNQEITWINLGETSANTVVAEGMLLDRIGPFGEFDSYCVKVRNEDGTLVGVPLAGQLKYLLDSNNVQKGDLVRITYQGKTAMKNRKGEAHTFDLAISTSGASSDTNLADI